MVRAVLDINVLVSALIGALGLSHQIVAAWADERFTLVSSEHIIRGMVDTALGPDLRRRFPTVAGPTRQLEGLLRTAAVLVIVLPEDVRTVTGDPEDDTVLTTVRLAQADYLVTGDKGLLSLRFHEGAGIVTPRDFLAVLQPPGDGAG